MSRREYRTSAIYLGRGVFTLGSPGQRYRVGAIATRYGFVSIYSQGFEKAVTARDARAYSVWTFIHDGKQHDLIRRDVVPTERGLIIIARRFAEAVVNGWPLP